MTLELSPELEQPNMQRRTSQTNSGHPLFEKMQIASLSGQSQQIERPVSQSVRITPGPIEQGTHQLNRLAPYSSSSNNNDAKEDSTALIPTNGNNGPVAPTGTFADVPHALDQMTMTSHRQLKTPKNGNEESVWGIFNIRFAPTTQGLKTIKNSPQSPGRVTDMAETQGHSTTPGHLHQIKTVALSSGSETGENPLPNQNNEAQLSEQYKILSPKQANTLHELWNSFNAQIPIETYPAFDKTSQQSQTDSGFKKHSIAINLFPHGALEEIPGSSNKPTVRLQAIEPRWTNSLIEEMGFITLAKGAKYEDPSIPLCCPVIPIIGEQLSPEEADLYKEVVTAWVSSITATYAPMTFYLWSGDQYWANRIPPDVLLMRLASQVPDPRVQLTKVSKTKSQQAWINKDTTDSMPPLTAITIGSGKENVVHLEPPTSHELLQWVAKITHARFDANLRPIITRTNELARRILTGENKLTEAEKEWIIHALNSWVTSLQYHLDVRINNILERHKAGDFMQEGNAEEVSVVNNVKPKVHEQKHEVVREIIFRETTKTVSH